MEDMQERLISSLKALQVSKAVLQISMGWQNLPINNYNADDKS